MSTIAETYALALKSHRSGNLQLAERLYRQVLQDDPNHADSLHMLGVLAYQTGRHDEAVRLIRQALALNPVDAAYYTNLGLAFEARGQVDEAVVCHEEALRLQPNHPEARNNLGNAFKNLGRLDEAESCYREALRLRPNYPKACNNLAGTLIAQEKYDEAIKWYREALRLKPDFAEARFNLGSALERQGKFHEALQCYDEFLRQPGPNPALIDRAHWIRSVLLLLLGDFRQGWPEHEWRWTRPGITLRPRDELTWDGSPLNGRTIVLYAEQGLGDTLQFIRYAPLVKERGGHVLFACPPPLSRLLTGAPGFDHIFAAGSPLPAHDVQAAVLSLPRILKTTLETIPANVPYLRADANLVEHWRRTLQPLQGFKVGIAWQGSTAYPRDAQRSIPLACFEPLAAVPGVRLISLQKGHGSEQLNSCQFLAISNQPILDEAAGAFMDTAAIMMNLDLVVTSDTVIPHLAGALGVPVWVALPQIPDWRWLLEREDSPWYPAMRLFRQSRYGHWEDVFERMAEELSS